MFEALDLPTLSIVLLLALVGILASGVWIAIALGLVGLLAMVLTTSVPIGSVMATRVWDSAASWQIAALPLGTTSIR